ncbi:arginine--tRNA ligase [Candidatus Woesearchaeota archaeon]|nr:arginine--tRNA ligase [Candidatus Woesearchaeota archaeon]
MASAMDLGALYRGAVERLLSGTPLRAVQLEVPDPRFGDLAVPVFSLAKGMRKEPAQIAKELAAELAKEVGADRLIGSVAAIGPYINFTFSDAKLAADVIRTVASQKECYGTAPASKRKVLLEYSAPNTNKPQHLGHIRNNLLGITVARLLAARGDTVVKANWVNDRGMGVAKANVAYLKWGKGAAPGKKPDHYVGDWYVRFQKELAKDATLEDEARANLKRWEDGDTQVRAVWKKMRDWVIEGYKETYGRLGCSFDIWYFESDIWDQAKPIIDEGLAKGVFIKDDAGNVVADLEGHGLPKKVVLRADGTSVYATADIILAKKKAELSPDVSIYCVGSEHDLYFRQLFKILELLGFSYAKNCHHLSYGLVYLPEGKMKSREGTVVDADDLMDGMHALAAEEVRKRYDDLDGKEVERRAESIGLAALKFYILKIDASRDIHFDPKESISFEGETGPYVQYAHARICSVLRQHEEQNGERSGAVAKRAAKLSFEVLAEDEEKRLVRMLYSYPETLAKAALDLKPSTLCRYLLDLAQGFSIFYQKHRIVQAEGAVRDARLLLADSVRQVLANGLGLLGIDAPERM